LLNLMTFNFVTEETSHFLIRETEDRLYVRVYRVLWFIDLLLGKYCKTNNETTTFAVKRRHKYASTTIKLLL
jgi:hypothetical protein